MVPIYRIESLYKHFFETYTSEAEAWEAAVEGIVEYVEENIEEFVDLETIGPLEDFESFINAVECGEISDTYDLAAAFRDMRAYIEKLRDELDKSIKYTTGEGLL